MIWCPVISSIECSENINKAIDNLNMAKYQAELSNMDNIQIRRIKLAIELLRGNRDDLIKE
jgi:hypothetical protein